MKAHLPLLVATVLFCVFVKVVHAGVIFSDDFGSGKNNPKLTALTHWNVTSGNVDLWNFKTFDGYSLDLDGHRANATIESKDSFTFVPGNLYELSFQFGNNNKSNNILYFGFSQATIFNETFEESIKGKPPAVTVKRAFSVNEEISSRLVFSERGIADFGGSVIDDVELRFTPVHVAEPSRVATYLVVLVGLFLWRIKAINFT